MKLRQVPSGSVFRPTEQWARFRMPGDKPMPDRFVVVAGAGGESVLCRPFGGGDAVHFHGELEVTK